MEGVIILARKAPELINLMNLDEYCPANVLQRALSSFGIEQPGSLLNPSMSDA
jgi:hypothetical protein